MLEVGWSELVVIAIVAILVVGPKDLPRMLRATGKMIAKVRRMAGEFQRQFEDALREADLDEVNRTARNTFKPLEDARKSMQSYQKEVKQSLAAKVDADSASKPPAKAEAAPVPAATAEPAVTPAGNGGGAPAEPVKKVAPAARSSNGVQKKAGATTPRPAQPARAASKPGSVAEAKAAKPRPARPRTSAKRKTATQEDQTG